jgi:hypothetical protein
MNERIAEGAEIAETISRRDRKEPRLAPAIHRAAPDPAVGRNLRPLRSPREIVSAISAPSASERRR